MENLVYVCTLVFLYACLDIYVMQKPNLIRDRSFNFSIRAVQLAQELDKQRAYVLSKQFLKSATSIGANVEEGTQGQSRKDFISKMSIALKEAQEARYWLRLMHATKIGDPVEIASLGIEASEIISILVRIVKSSRHSR